MTRKNNQARSSASIVAALAMTALTSLSATQTQAAPVRIDLFDTDLVDFVRESSRYLSYSVTVDSELKKRFSLIANLPNEDKYQALFESVIRSHGLDVVDMGAVRVIKQPEPDQPVMRTLNFEHATAADLVNDLNAILTPAELPYAITASNVSNALVLSAHPKLLPTIERFHKSRDIARRQVYIEAVAFESTIRKLRSIGLDGKFRMGDAQVSVNPSLSSAGTVAYSLLGSTLSLNYQAMENDSDIQVISTPSLTVQDRATGKLDIGQEVPIITGSVRQDDGQVYQTIERKEIGVRLAVTPTVINPNQISINVKQSVSRIDTDIEASDVVFDQKALATTLQVKDGQTIYLGGLIADSSEQIDQGVPLLRSLPLLGSLFTLDRNDQGKRVFSLLLKVRVL